MSTIRDLLKIALQKIEVLAPGEDLEGQDAEDARQQFALMVDGFAVHQMLIPITTVVTKVLAIGQNDYTIGNYPDPVPDPLPDNHIETTHPIEFLGAFLRDSAGTDYPLMFIEQNLYNQVNRKDNTARPTQLYIQRGWPLSTLRFNSNPFSNDQLHLTVKKPLGDYIATSSLNSVVNLPPGYERFLVYSLAVELAPTWGKRVPPEIAVIAEDSMKRIKRAFNRPGFLTTSPHMSTRSRRTGGSYNIESGP